MDVAELQEGGCAVMTGMEIYTNRKTYFYPTNSTRRTTQLARRVAAQILTDMGKEDAPNDATIQFVKTHMQPCELDYHTLLNGDKWVCMHSDTHSYNAPADDPSTVILKGDV